MGKERKTRRGEKKNRSIRGIEDGQERKRR